MNKIEFKRTSNIFINSGIVALDYYLQECKAENHLGYNDFDFELSKDTLVISCESEEKLFKLLYDVYYFMGKDIYDCFVDDGNKKFFFRKEPFQAVEFSKMSSFGLGGLITSPPFGPQPTARIDNNSIKFQRLLTDEKEFAIKIAKYLNDNGIKLKGYKYDRTNNDVKVDKSVKQGDSVIFLNEPYTKTPIIKIKPEYFRDGDSICSITGLKVKQLLTIDSVSPFISGEAGNTKTFDSFITVNSSRPVSFHAIYLSRFSPKLFLYHYATKEKASINVFGFTSKDLLSLKKIYHVNLSFFKTKIELNHEKYSSSFNVYGFGSSVPEFFCEKDELAFMIIYTFYKQFFNDINDGDLNVDDYNPFLEILSPSFKINLVSFKADKFGKNTMRPTSFEVINNFKFLMRLIYHLEKNGINFQQLNYSLKILKPKDRSNANYLRIERQVRNNIYGKIIKNKSIIDEVEYIFYECYKILVSPKIKDGFSLGYKNYKQLILLLTLYESIINNGGNKNMDKELQQKAINLGKSIGQGILNFGGDSQIENARNGKKYIVALRKARTFSQFKDLLIRIQTKFLILVSNDIIVQINEQNFNNIKQFAIISALNQLNSVLQTNKSNQDEKK